MWALDYEALEGRGGMGSASPRLVQQVSGHLLRISQSVGPTEFRVPDLEGRPGENWQRQLLIREIRVEQFPVIGGMEFGHRPELESLRRVELRMSFHRPEDRAAFGVGQP